MSAPHSASVDGPPLAFLAGGGEMGERMRAFAWESTPLGPPEVWPQSLRTCVRILLTSSQPMFVWWGDELLNLYNDAYKAIVGGKHPRALGQPATEVWAEIWEQIAPRAESCLRHNAGTYDEALLLIMERNGYREETYYTFSYSPVPNDDDTVGGIVCANTEDTRRIVGERQVATLRELASGTLEARTAPEACERAAVALGHARRDLPFCAIYLVDPAQKQFTLQATSGLDRGHPAAPSSIGLEAPIPWPLGRAHASHETIVLDVDGLSFGGLPQGDWDRAPCKVALVPFGSPAHGGHTGVIVAGLNPYRLFDDGYRGFLGLVANQVAAGVAGAEAYEQERQRAEALAQIDRAKTAFFSNVSHEFRTPLTLMLGPIEDALASSERALGGENLEIAYRNALRLLKLVNALLDFSRIEAGRMRASYEPTDLAQLTVDLASAFRSAVERAGLAFEVDCPPLPEALYVDRDMWEKIVLNLLSNGFKYTFAGTIRVSLAWLGDGAELAVVDTGTGIPAHELPHLFERFHRVQGSRARTHEGSGIGLALVSELVRLHGGTVGVESVVGQGTTFRVRLPRGTAHLPSESVRPGEVRPSAAAGVLPFVEEARRWSSHSEVSEISPSPHDGRAAPRLEGNGAARVLVADDNADMREYLTRLLGERFTVVAASDGLSALAEATKSPPDLVLTDVMMPRLDGFGLLARLRADERTRAVPVIMLSARAGEEARVEGLEAGADDYLVKPFSARELLARVATHLQIAKLRAESERQRARLEQIFEGAPVPVAVLAGPDLRFEVANPPFLAMIARTDVRGRGLREVFPELAEGSVLERVEEAYRTGEPFQVADQEVPLARPQGRGTAFFSYAIQPLRDERGEVIRLIAVGVEVTEQVLARRRVDGLRAAAESANRAKDYFLATLSHELRTPLNAIVGWSSLLRANAVPPEQRERALEAIERNARMQARLIEEMLDLSRIEQGKLALSVGPLELVRVVEAAIDAVRLAADAKEIRLELVLDSHATIVGDADRLQQVVWNLLSNAIKFTPRRGRVQIRLRREQSSVEIVVADDGQGIAPDFLPHVFERFRQADPSFTRRAGGLGLGLAIVRALVELHGGDVRAASDGVDQGATFTVRLPTAPLRGDGRPTPELPPSNASAGVEFECPPSVPGLRVLVVDDEPGTRELLRFVLERCAAVVTTAGGVEEALAAFEHQTFDLVISDIGMPGEDGYTLVRKIRALPRAQGGGVPALALTAYARAEDRAQVLRAGFNMHLAKPIDPAELLVVVEALVRDTKRGP